PTTERCLGTRAPLARAIHSPGPCCRWPCCCRQVGHASVLLSRRGVRYASAAGPPCSAASPPVPPCPQSSPVSWQARQSSHHGARERAEPPAQSSKYRALPQTHSTLPRRGRNRLGTAPPAVERRKTPPRYRRDQRAVGEMRRPQESGIARLA